MLLFTATFGGGVGHATALLVAKEEPGGGAPGFDCVETIPTILGGRTTPIALRRAVG